MIRVESLTFTYPGGDRPAVRDLPFDIAEGEVLGFLGSSGAGKSFTQNILIGLLDGWQRTAEVLERRLEAWGSDYYRSIGSFEFPNHYLKLMARENLELFRALLGGAAETVEAVLELVDLSEAVDVRVGEFSKGMKQRLTFATSLPRASTRSTRAASWRSSRTVSGRESRPFSPPTTCRSPIVSAIAWGSSSTAALG